MSLLMDALKRADETKSTHSNLVEPSTTEHINWEAQLFPQFQKDLAEIEQETEALLLTSPISEDITADIDWNTQFLPDFTVTETVAKEEDSSSTSLSQEDTIPSIDEAIVEEMSIEPVVQASTQPDEIHEKVTAPQFTIPPVYTDSLTLNFVKGNTTAPEPSITSDTPPSPKPQDAQAILLAHKTPKRLTRTHWLLIILGIVIIGLGIGYYYIDQMVTTSTVRAPRRPLLPSPKTEITTQPINQSENLATNSISDENSSKKIVETTKNDITALKQKVLTALIPPAAEKTNVATSPITPTIKQEVKLKEETKSSPEKPKKTTTEVKNTTDSKTNKKSSSAEEYAQVQNTPGIHKLQKNPPSAQFNQNLTMAYSAFQNGNDVKAKTLYQKVLQQDKTSRDALLGLAAIAVRQDQPKQAENYYKQILRLYPQDNTAQLGLLSVLGDKTPDYTESQLKQLVENNPQSAYSYFNLGNYYANQKLWEKAQQAYFEAYRYDEQQANYAYNLAVSLDQLNQYATATLYYQRAIALSRQTTTQYFDIQAIQQRLQTLSQSTSNSALTELSAHSLSQE